MAYSERDGQVVLTLSREDQPLCIVLYAGLHGWEEGFVSEGWRCVGFDIEDMCAKFGHRRPANVQLVLQDVLTLHGSQFRDAAVIVASPPCQEYSYRAMPWSRARSLPPPDNSLFDACFRIQCEANEASGRFIPLIVENVRGAQKWVGRAKWHFGSYYLWGDVPALMPIARSRKIAGHTRHLTNPAEHVRIDDAGIKLQSPGHYLLKKGSGPDWYDGGAGAFASNSIKRALVSAMLAKIPSPLAQHIARCFKPQFPVNRLNQGNPSYTPGPGGRCQTLKISAPPNRSVRNAFIG